jgi:hypothetical protein
MGKDESSPRGAGRSYSFSAEDLKRSQYEQLVSKDGGHEEKKPLKSPGIGNSEVKGRDYGFSSVE